jgi:hypothetical protein
VVLLGVRVVCNVVRRAHIYADQAHFRKYGGMWSGWKSASRQKLDD